MHQNVIDNSKESSEVKVESLASMNNFDRGSKFNLCSSKNIFSSNFKNRDSSRFVDVLNDVNNYDFYHDEIIDSNIFDQTDESEESTIGDRKKGRKSVESLNDIENGGFDFDETIDMKEFDQNNEIEETQTKKRSRKNTVRNNVKGGKRGSRSLRSTSRSNNVNYNVKTK
ncbi:22702_t:CDS:2 [Gigaspora margarita]|uniref:22702_t:CDS:1 n=1 Tax=Gigaspora margarita TaxID=4874 RepID=A0ABM8W387_GIGMA|nr:22702_t:CDS:2 [Gigaspora margarita]